MGNWKPCDECGAQPPGDGAWRARTGRDGVRRCPACRESTPLIRESHRCSSCLEVQPIGEFYVCERGWVQGACKTCILARHREVKYGVSAEEYNALVLKQAGCCAICQQPAKLYVDHCHDRGQVRGLLCDGCNKGIGHLGDDPDRLMSAAAYLMARIDVLGGRRDGQA